MGSRFGFFVVFGWVRSSILVDGPGFGRVRSSVFLDLGLGSGKQVRSSGSLEGFERVQSLIFVDKLGF